MVDDRTALMSARALTPGYEVLWYTIDRVLGQGGFGITYLAHDRNLDRAVAIKEYLPTSFAYRHEDYSVKPITGDHRENFIWGLSSFLKEAQTLARFSHPNIVRVHSVFEKNNTAYMVMEYEHGQNLANIYKQRSNLDQAFFEQVFFPIINGLKEIHKFDFIHRDIKPANIYIRENGTPVLIDFGSARRTTQQQTNEMTTLVSQGYTPLEQYSANYGDQGPWTDIYAMAATLYEGVVGKKPDESLSRSACLMRSKPDLLERLDARVYTGFSQKFLNAVFAGLKLEPEGRPQSLEEWADVFANGDDRFEPGAPSLGFTGLEDDRTRIQPRKTVPEPSLEDFDSFIELDSGISSARSRDSQRIPTKAPERAGNGQSLRPEPVRFAPATDPLQFDDEDLDTSDRQRSHRPSPITQKKTVIQKKQKKGSGLIIMALGLLVVLGAGGGYYFYQGNQATGGLTAEVLASMTPPAQATTTVLPEERVMGQLDNMAALAPLLSEAYALEPDDPVLMNTIQATEASLLGMARKWNASQYPDIANRIRLVSLALPAAVHDQARIQGVLSASGDVSAYSRVMALLDDKRYLLPAGDSVLDRITSVSASDYQQLKSSTQWQQMMSTFSSAAMDKLAQSRFDEAARLTEAVLTMDSANSGFVALRSFLAGS